MVDLIYMAIRTAILKPLSILQKHNLDSFKTTAVCSQTYLEHAVHDCVFIRLCVNFICFFGVQKMSFLSAETFQTFSSVTKLMVNAILFHCSLKACVCAATLPRHNV